MKPLEILPALDLRGGRCVRLRRGRAEEETVYSGDPAGVARRFAEDGAPRLHVVDLDGAFRGRPVHLAALGEIVRAAGRPVQAGGGLRTDADIEAVLAAGADRAILGTRALSDPDEVRRLARRFAGRLAVGIDARDGFVQVRGWTETTGVRAADLARRMAGDGVRVLIATDTGRDGMLRGVNAEAVAEVCDAAPGCSVIASGGVAGTGDILALRTLDRDNLRGVICGKAIYDGAVSLRGLIEAAGAGPPPLPGARGARERREVRFSGRVQGVGFRFRVLREAAGLAVSGFVRNLPDGRVQLRIEGAPDELDRLMARIRSASGGDLRGVEEQAGPPTGEFDGFSIRD